MRRAGIADVVGARVHAQDLTWHFFDAYDINLALALGDLDLCLFGHDLLHVWYLRVQRLVTYY